VTAIYSLSTATSAAPDRTAACLPTPGPCTATLSSQHAAGESTSVATLPTPNLDPIDLLDTCRCYPPTLASLSLYSLCSYYGNGDDRRVSRRDKHLRSTSPHLFWPRQATSYLRRFPVGAAPCPTLPPFNLTMSTRRRQANVPATPRVISPSPTPSEREQDSSYSAPITRSSTRSRVSSPQPVEEEEEEDSDELPGVRRARTRSRSPIKTRGVQRMTTRRSSKQTAPVIVEEVETSNGVAAKVNGHLAPPQPAAYSGWTWRDFSRSPSPLGLIPIHRHWRTFVHKHEVPRKLLHVSIGFFVIWLYIGGSQTSSIPPWLMAGLIPITFTDWLRHRYASVNRLYVRVLGALMRESEFAGWNGVIWYLLGAWIVLYFFPKDVAVMSVLLLSWCDTAASTFGRLWGRYTPRLRRGKSLAGSLAAFIVGVATSYAFYGWLTKTIGPMPGDDAFMFKGALSLPSTVTDLLGITREQATITGPLALGVMSLWSGFVASASEVVDLFGWDDNLTIPVLSGMGMWAFLKVFT
jgi:diacylglycerol kinase (CTP)